MAETIAKRTFFEGCYIELFKRNDGTHRIKYVSPSGDEITLNLSSKGWAQGLPSQHFEEIAYSPEQIPDFTGVGSALPEYLALWRLMISMDKTIHHVLQPLGVSMETMYPSGGVGAEAPTTA